MDAAVWLLTARDKAAWAKRERPSALVSKILPLIDKSL